MTGAPRDVSGPGGRSVQGRVADILEAVERCRRYVSVLDVETDVTVADMAERGRVPV